jgi:predicted GIY-YIG superfamily endonuclease
MADLAGLVMGAKATLDHIVAVDRKIDQLREKKLDAEEAFLCRLRTLYAQELFTIDDLVSLAESWAPCYFEAGWEERWVSAGLPSVEDLRSIWAETIKYTPTGPHGSWTNYDPRWDRSLPDWVSCTPSDENPMPPRGQSVVYVLYDRFGIPCYVGSTGDFPQRLKWHLKDRKPVVVWVAFPCDNREAAYSLEDRLLKQHMPYLNKKRGA